MLKKILAAYLNRLTFWLSEKGFGQFDSALIKADMETLAGVKGVRNLHVWRQAKNKNALAAHIVIEDFRYMHEIKTSLKAFLANRYDIHHSYLEFEKADSGGVSTG